MTDAPFLATIDAHPDDYGPLLVWADFLAERGDTVAEDVLRWAVRMNRMPRKTGPDGRLMWAGASYRMRLGMRFHLPKAMLNQRGGVIVFRCHSLAWLALIAAWRKSRPSQRRAWMRLKGPKERVSS